MLSISLSLKGISRADYYLQLAIGKYYQTDGPGLWYGGGSKLLKLDGPVQTEPFHNLLRGFTPDGSRALVQNAGDPNRWMGWDLTLSAPKSVSVLFAVASRRVRKKILKAHARAVRRALDFLEQTAGITRSGKNGRIWNKTPLVFVLFLHFTSRTLDPQIHTHVITLNVGFRGDGTTGAIHSVCIFRQKMAAGHVYQTELAAQLRHELGLTIEPDKVGFYIQGVPRELCREQSTRRRQIEGKMEAKGLAGAKAAAKVALNTRPSKREVSRDKLFARWAQQAAAHGFGPRQAQRLVQPQKVREFKAEFEHAFAEATRFIRAEQKSPARIMILASRLAQQHGATSKEMLTVLKKHRPKQGLFHLEWQRLFPKAPNWSPASKIKAPVIVIGTRPRPRKWGAVIWKKSLIVGELRLQKKRLFPRAPKWSPAHHMELPVLRVVKKSATSGQAQTAQQSKGHSQSH